MINCIQKRLFLIIYRRPTRILLLGTTISYITISEKKTFFLFNRTIRIQSFEHCTNKYI